MTLAPRVEQRGVSHRQSVTPCPVNTKLATLLNRLNIWNLKIQNKVYIAQAYIDPIWPASQALGLQMYAAILGSKHKAFRVST